MRRSFSLLASAVFAAGVLSAGSLPAPAPVAAATIIAATTTCNNSTDNTPGLGAICEVTIENTITAVGGSATVTVRECHGAAGDPEASCATQVTVLTEPVTHVSQCNDSMNGGGGTLRCSVQVTNTFVAEESESTDATVNQCVGSADDLANDCDPFPANAPSATITQCNGSANGGTLVELTCTATGTRSNGFSVTVDQCNDSTNGGGALVICSANIDAVFAPAASPSPSAEPTAAPTNEPTGGPSGEPTAGPTNEPTAAPTAEPTAEPTGQSAAEPTPSRAPATTTAQPRPRVTPPSTDTAPGSTTASRIDGTILALAALLAAAGVALVTRRVRAPVA